MWLFHQNIYFLAQTRGAPLNSTIFNTTTLLCKNHRKCTGGSTAVEALSWYRRRVIQHPAIQSTVHPWKMPQDYCPFAAPCWPSQVENRPRGQGSTFPSETTRFAPLILAHKGFALPWLVDDRAPLRFRRIVAHSPDRARPRIMFVRAAAPIPDTRLFATVPPLPLACHHLPIDTKLKLGKGAPGENHSHTTIPPPRINRSVESRRQPVGGAPGSGGTK